MRSYLVVPYGSAWGLYCVAKKACMLYGSRDVLKACALRLNGGL